MDEISCIVQGIAARRRATAAVVAGAWVQKRPNVVVTSLGEGPPWLNVAHVTGPSPDLAWIAETFRSAGVASWSVTVVDGADPLVEQQLISMGLKAERPLNGMLRVPAAGTDRAVRGLAIVPVRDEAERADHVRVMSEGFAADHALIDRLHPPAMLGRSSQRLFTGYTGSAPVASAEAVSFQTTVGVGGVSVVPSMRGRGIGPAMTEHAVASMPDATAAWLLAYDDVAPIYEDLGFRTVCAIRSYI